MEIIPDQTIHAQIPRRIFLALFCDPPDEMRKSFPRIKFGPAAFLEFRVHEGRIGLCAGYYPLSILICCGDCVPAPITAKWSWDDPLEAIKIPRRPAPFELHSATVTIEDWLTFYTAIGQCPGCKRVYWV